MKRKYQLSIAYIVIALLGISLYHLWTSSKITEDPAYTKGVVNKLYKIRATPYYSYSYNVDEKTYEGKSKQYGEYKSLQIGDTITVYYQRSNPSNSEAYVKMNKQQIQSFSYNYILALSLEATNRYALRKVFLYSLGHTYLYLRIYIL